VCYVCLKRVTVKCW